MTEQRKIMIDNQEHNLADLPQEVLVQINNLRVTEQEIARQESMLAMLRTAQAAYGQKLGEAMKDVKVKKPTEKNAKAKAAPKAAVKAADKSKKH